MSLLLILEVVACREAIIWLWDTYRNMMSKQCSSMSTKTMEVEGISYGEEAWEQ